MLREFSRTLHTHERQTHTQTQFTPNIIKSFLQLLLLRSYFRWKIGENRLQHNELLRYESIRSATTLNFSFLLNGFCYFIRYLLFTSLFFPLHLLLLLLLRLSLFDTEKNINYAIERKCGTQERVEFFFLLVSVRSSIFHNILCTLDEKYNNCLLFFFCCLSFFGCKTDWKSYIMFPRF